MTNWTTLSCRARGCNRTADIRVTWPNSTPGEPEHERLLCELHFQETFGNRLERLGNLNSERLRPQ